MTNANLALLADKIDRNTALTLKIEEKLEHGFQTIDNRVNRAERRLDKIEWRHEQLAEHPPVVIKEKTIRGMMVDNKWLIAQLVSIILALIGAKTL